MHTALRLRVRAVMGKSPAAPQARCGRAVLRVPGGCQLLIERDFLSPRPFSGIFWGFSEKYENV